MTEPAASQSPSPSHFDGGGGRTPGTLRPYCLSHRRHSVTVVGVDRHGKAPWTRKPSS